MITQEIEIFTAEQAAAAGLNEAIKRGETRFEGSYECGKGVFTFKQQNFVFTDKFGSLRVGRFADDDSVARFIKFLRTGEI